MIPIFKPSLGKEELKSLEEIFKTGWIGLGPKTRKFEEKFSEFIGTKYAVGVNSASAALHLSLKVLNITGGEVLIPALTFISTALAANYNNCTPVFVDSEEDTLNIDINDLESKITNKTK